MKILQTIQYISIIISIAIIILITYLTEASDNKFFYENFFLLIGLAAFPTLLISVISDISTGKAYAAHRDPIEADKNSVTYVVSLVTRIILLVVICYSCYFVLLK